MHIKKQEKFKNKYKTLLLRLLYINKLTIEYKCKILGTI